MKTPILYRGKQYPNGDYVYRRHELKDIRFSAAHEEEFSSFDPRTLKVGQRQKRKTKDCFCTRVRHNIEVYRGKSIAGELGYMPEEYVNQLDELDKKIVEHEEAMRVIRKQQVEIMEEASARLKAITVEEVIAIHSATPRLSAVSTQPTGEG